MRTVYYPNNFRQPAVATYGIAYSVGDFAPQVDIVIINSHRLGPTTSIINCDQGLNTALNQILDNDLKGIRTEFIRLFVISHLENYPLRGFEAEIHLDLDDYVRRGNPCDISYSPFPTLGALLHPFGYGEKKRSFLSANVVAGCARFFTEIDAATAIPQEEIKRLCDAVGFNLDEPTAEPQAANGTSN